MPDVLKNRETKGPRLHVLVKFSWNGRSRGSKPWTSLRFFEHLGSSFFADHSYASASSSSRCHAIIHPAVSKRDSVFARRRRRVPRYSSGFSLTRVTGSWFIPGTRAGTCHNICIIRELASSIFIFRNVHGVLNFISRLSSARPLSFY